MMIVPGFWFDFWALVAHCLFTRCPSLVHLLPVACSFLKACSLDVSGMLSVSGSAFIPCNILPKFVPLHHNFKIKRL